MATLITSAVLSECDATVYVGDVFAGAVDAVHCFDPFRVERSPALVAGGTADEVENDCRDAAKIDNCGSVVKQRLLS